MLYAGMCAKVQLWRPEDNLSCGIRLSLSTTWILEIEVRSSGLVAGALTCNHLTSPTCLFLFCFLTISHIAAQAAIELIAIFLLKPYHCSDYKCKSQYLVCSNFLNDTLHKMAISLGFSYELFYSISLNTKMDTSTLKYNRPDGSGAHTFTTSTQEAEAEESTSFRLAWP